MRHYYSGIPKSGDLFSRVFPFSRKPLSDFLEAGVNTLCCELREAEQDTRLRGSPFLFMPLILSVFVSRSAAFVNFFPQKGREGRSNVKCRGDLGIQRFHRRPSICLSVFRSEACSNSQHLHRTEPFGARGSEWQPVLFLAGFPPCSTPFLLPESVSYHSSTFFPSYKHFLLPHLLFSLPFVPMGQFHFYSFQWDFSKEYAKTTMFDYLVTTKLKSIGGPVGRLV